jgi:transposase InsO family protein
MSDDKRGEYLPAALNFLEDFLEISLRHAQWRVRRPVRGDRRVAQAVDHDGGGVLCRDAGGCFGSSRQAGHLQYGQGSQFTGQAFTGVLADNGIAISMDGKGAWRDNVFVERCGAASNTRRCICARTERLARFVGYVRRSAAE